MHPHNIALLVLVTSAAGPALTVPLPARNATDASPAANLSTPLQSGQLIASGSAQNAHARDFFNDPLQDMSNFILCDYTLNNHVPCSSQDIWFKGGGLNTRRFDSRQEIQARAPSILTLFKFAWLYKFLKGAGVIFGRQEIASDQLAAHNSVGGSELVADNAEGPNSREFHAQQGIRPLEVRIEAVARDDTADDVPVALLKSRESEITPEDQDLRGSASLASRVFDDLD